MTFERARRKLQLAADRELERMRRGEDMANRAQRNLERGQRNAESGRRRVHYFQELIRKLDDVETAVN